MGSPLGDYIRAIVLLKVTDPEEAGKIAGMLGLQLKPSTTATPATDAGKDKESEPATPTK